MIPLLLLGLVSLSSASSPPAEQTRGEWRVVDAGNGGTCILFYAQIDLNLSYIKDGSDALADADRFTVPFNATVDPDKSSCYEKVQIGDEFIDSQVLQLNFPDNEGWNVRIAFTQDPRMGVTVGDYALWQVNVTANYSSMNETFPDAAHTHTYYSVIDFTDPPEIAIDETAKVGMSFNCPSPQGFIINSEEHNGPQAFIRLSNLLMQAYMNSEDFGKQMTCPVDQDEVDLVPIIVSSVLAVLVLFTLIAYFVYRSRLPTDILDMTQPEFEEEEDHHHQKEHSSLNHHDNYGYHEEDHRF